MTDNLGSLLSTEIQRKEQGLPPSPMAIALSTRGAPPPLEEAKTLWDAFETGLETSTSGLILRQQGPDLVLQADPTRAQTLANMAGTMIGDLPTLLVGGVAGSAGGPVGAGAGAMALTEGTRHWLLEQYSEGYTRRDVSDRLASTAWATAKGAVIGGATLGAGRAVTGLVGSSTTMGAMRGVPLVSSRFGQVAATTSAELATMTSVASMLEGELPDPNDFVNIAILFGGLRGATSLSGKLRAIYARTGKRPEEVYKEAMQDSKVYQELIDETGAAIPETMRGAETGRFALSEESFSKVINEPFKEPAPQSAQPRVKEEINTRTWTDAKDIENGLATLSGAFERQIKTDMEAGRRTNQEAYQQALTWLRDTVGEDSLPNSALMKTDPVRWQAEVLARQEVLVNMTRRWQEKAFEIKEKGSGVTEAELVEFRGLTEQTGTALAIYRNRAAEAARALAVQNRGRVLKTAEEQHKLYQEYLDATGGKAKAEAEAQFIASIADPRDLINAAKKPTFMEKFAYVFKGFLVSGVRTQEVNILSNMSFALTRVPESSLASAIGRIRGTKRGERIEPEEAYYLLQGLTKGALDSVRGGYRYSKENIESNGFIQGALETYRGIQPSKKSEVAETPSGAIKTPEQLFESKFGLALGKTAEVAFKGLAVGDNFTGLMNARATEYAMAARIAKTKHNLKPGTRAFNEKMQELVSTDKKIQKAGLDAWEKYNFLEEGGSIVKGLMGLRRQIPILNVLPLPFLQTPGAIMQQFFRRTPAAPFVRQWREQWQKGGVERDKAYAELAFGTGVGLLAFTMARDGFITGGGHPDKEVRNAWRAAGWQPYSIRTDQGYFSINRYEPIATILGMAADVSTAWELMETDEQDKAAATLAYAFAEVMANKTWLKGVSSVVNAFADPARYGGSWVEDLAGLAVPQAIAQPAQMMDPYVRDVDGIIQNVMNRLPIVRHQLPVRYDIFGQPIKASPGLWPSSPTTVSKPSTDKVRLEAARLGVAQPEAPDKASAGSILGQSAQIELTAEQRDVFAQESGQTAYKIMQNMVDSPAWGKMHPAIQRRLFERAFVVGRRRANLLAIPPAERVTAMGNLLEEMQL